MQSEVYSTVADHSTHNLKIEGSNPTTGTGREKMTKKFSTIIEILMLDPILTARAYFRNFEKF